MVKQDISSAADLKGKKLATPQLGGTQDVALRAWLKDQGLNADTSGGGDVSIQPQDNGATLDAFKTGAIDGAWVPEPWATRLVLEGHGKTLVDERTLWPGGQFVTTHLIVSKKFLDDHPDVVKRLLEGQVKANDYVNANRPKPRRPSTIRSRRSPEAHVRRHAGGELEEHVIHERPVASTLAQSAPRPSRSGCSTRSISRASMPSIRSTRC